MKSKIGFCLICFGLIMCISAPCRSEENELLASLLKTVNWLEGVGSHQLEVVLAVQTESDRPKVIFNEIARNAESSYFESISKLRTVANADDNSFVVVSCLGLSSFGMDMSDSGVSPQSEDESEFTIARFSSGVLTRYDQKGNAIAISRKKVRNVFAVAGEFTPGLNFPIFPLTLYNDNTAEESTNIELIIDELIDYKDARLRITSEECEIDGKSFRVWRFARQGVDVDMGFRFVVSNEGFDKGLVVEFHEGVLKRGNGPIRYQQEDQLTDQFSASNFITWKKFENTSGQSEYILPVTILKKAKIGFSGKKSATIRSSFDWKSFDSPDTESMSVEEIVNIGKQYRKDIDRRLRR